MLTVEAAARRGAPRAGIQGIRLAARGILVVTVAQMILSGCAGKGVKPGESKHESRSVRLSERSDLPDLAKGIHTREDSLILDLLLGYRMLILREPDANALDKETLRRGRAAFDKLENAIRHGGLRSQDPGERVYTITSEERLSLQEVLKSVSDAAVKSSRAGDWERARARWLEITGSKAAVAWAIEEAQWGLALSDALSSSLAQDIKGRLRGVDESYAREVSQEEISRMVKGLLGEIQDEKLKRELKKLANRAWERDKRAGKLNANSGSLPKLDTIAESEVIEGESLPSAPASQVTEGVDSSSGFGAGQALPRVDSLINQGKYLAALKALEAAGAADQGQVKERKARIGDQYCEEKRRGAANSFKDFKKARNDEERKNLLKRTASDLDSCLFYFPDNPVSQKVRRNREMVEAELKKLKL